MSVGHHVAESAATESIFQPDDSVVFLWVYHQFHHLEGMKEDFKQTYCVTMSHEVETETCGSPSNFFLLYKW